MKPLKKEYMSNAQSNLIWSEREHSGKRAINHQFSTNLMDNQSFAR